MTGIKKVSQQIHKEKIDHTTGEVTEETTETIGYAEREPDYIKLYMKDILRLKDLPKESNNILLAILKQMSYDQQIILISSVKRKIAKELNLKVGTVSKTIEAFCKKDILIREDRGLYTINPYYFGRGKWEDIKQIRLSIQYSAEGRMILRTKTNEDVGPIEVFEKEKKEAS